MPKVDSELALQVRCAVAEFFSVPESKIYPIDNLTSDLRVSTLEPAFHTYVVLRVVEKRGIRPKPFLFTIDGLTDMGELVLAIGRVIGLSDSRIQ